MKTITLKITTLTFKIALLAAIWSMSLLALLALGKSAMAMM